MTDFDLPSASLEGTNLIEASAGTGKTFTISRIFLRLLLEEHLSVDQILVVTFTEAATEELKLRIRSLLVQLQDMEKSRGDAFLELLASRCAHSEGMKRLLDTAIKDFDTAAIYTIHGFCRRVLHDNAFESATLFDTELVADQEPLLQEVLDDFWRKISQEHSDLFFAYLYRELPPAELSRLVIDHVSKPFLRLVPAVDARKTDEAEAIYGEAVRQVKKQWAACGEEIGEYLRSSADLHRGLYRPGRVERILSVLEGLSEHEPLSGEQRRELSRITPEGLCSGVKKGSTPWEHPFFQRCGALHEQAEDLDAAFAMRKMRLIRDAFQYVQRQLRLRKERLNVQFFDDLLAKLHRSLLRPRGESLARKIRLRYKAALIDEFQDTDPLQYAIFQKIFGDGPLFMIGDPKQSIYSFRGADVFAYLDASRQTSRKYSLSRNYRSDKSLVEAINALFSSRPLPFLFPEIGYQEAVGVHGRDDMPLTWNGRNVAPLRFQFLDRKTRGQISKREAAERALRGLAWEIQRLLGFDGKPPARLGQDALKPKDIAVLVRKNDQAKQVQKALQDAGIPSVLYCTESLFLSREAEQFLILLRAIAEPTDAGCIKTAMSTDLFPHSLEEIYRIGSDDAAWEQWFQRFKAYHDIWQSRGFIPMIRAFKRDHRVGEVLLSLPGGERRITNFLHLVEVLHQAAGSRRLGMTGLIKWLSRAISRAAGASEEHQIRLATDEEAVWIVTIHRSKGLEFPVVFCPFAWDAQRDEEKMPVFHDEKDGLVLDLGSDELEDHRKAAKREGLAEDLRLLYVAVSRSEKHCSIFWGNVNFAEHSALAYLLHSLEEEPEAVSGFKGLEDRDMLAVLQDLASRSRDTVQVSSLHEGESVPARGAPARSRHLEVSEVSLPRPQRRPSRAWRLTSFSALASGRRGQAEEPMDHDAWVEPAWRHSDEELEGIFAFPRGTDAGSFFHSIFEELDFTAAAPDAVEELARSLLERYGFDGAWAAVVGGTVRKVLDLPLDGRDLRLAAIPRNRTLRELEFTFPLSRIDPAGLAEILSGLGELSFSAVEGFIRGFVDLVFQHGERFYLLDWKSSFLGGRIEDYRSEALVRVMLEEHYVLQYHLYTVALHRYLGSRVSGYRYDRHFGGVFYLFLRGIDPVLGSGYGVFHDTPSLELIRKLDDYFGGEL